MRILQPEPTQPGEFGWIYLLSAVLTLIGLVGVLVGYTYYARQRAFNSWKLLEARIVDRRVQKPTRPGGKSEAVRFEGIIEFETEGMEPLRGTRMFPESPIQSQSTVEEWLSRFPERIQVRQNPENPEEVIYFRGGSNIGLIALTSGMAFLFAAGAMLYLGSTF
jgi:hypothetical protein